MITNMPRKSLQHADGDDDVVFEEDEEEDEGYLFAGEGTFLKIFILNN